MGPWKDARIGLEDAKFLLKKEAEIGGVPPNREAEGDSGDSKNP